MKHFIFFLLFCYTLGVSAKNPHETNAQYTKRMKWFQEAKLGVFIHWGIYSVNGIDESWSFYNGYLPYKDYMRQLDGFSASHYQPEEWAKLFKYAGAKYAVITTKHHDGVALWNTKTNHYNVVVNTPAKRDLVDPFVKALRKEELKVGLYYSLIDWSHPDYDGFTKQEKKYKTDSVRFGKFRKFMFTQLNELGKSFNPDLVWFDGDWEHTVNEWNSSGIQTLLNEYNPNVIINNRLGKSFGDYTTPENGVPITSPHAPYWELCYTMNSSWGYQPSDNRYKTPLMLINTFVECLSMGGNLLLNISPKADGRIPERQKNILQAFGRWTQKHQEAIYPTIAGIPDGHFNGETTLSKDSTILYLYFDYQPNGALQIKGLKNKIQRMWVVGTGTRLQWEIHNKAYWSQVPGIVYFHVPEVAYDKDVTVVAVLLKEKIDLYREKGQKITSNE